MPTHYREDEKPVVEFNPQLEVSPFAVFRRLRQGAALRLLDVRQTPGDFTLKGAEPWPGEDWQPPPDEEIVLVDEDGTLALPIARRLQMAGHENVKALFGGLELWRFSLDPEVVGGETYLITQARDTTSQR